MKKIMFAAALLVASLSANAQVYIGGGVGLHSITPESVEGAPAPDDITTIKLSPEVGFKLDDKLSLGLAVGYDHSKQGDVKNTTWSLDPYVRYTFAKWNNVGFFGEAGFGYQHSEKNTKVDEAEVTTGKTNTWYIGVRPGISVDITSHFTFLTKIGWFGYESWKKDTDKAKAGSDFGLDLDASNIQFALLYNF